MTDGFMIAVIVSACLICTFSICLITYDFILTNKASRRKINIDEKNNSIGSSNIEENQKSEEILDKDIISFSQMKKETFKEKYNKLDYIYKNYCDEIEKKALQVKNAKRRETNNHIDVKVGLIPIIRLLIKRDILTCEFYFSNFDFKAYSKENGLKYKSAPITIRVLNGDDFLAVLDTIDIASKAIQDEKIYKKELKKRRKEEKENSLKL